MSWKVFKKEILELSTSQKFFIVCAMICGFCIMGDYGIVRPVSHSVFLSTYGSHFFPYVWIAIVPFNFLIIELYNRFLPKIGIQRMFYSILGCIVGINVLAALFLSKIPAFPFFFYIWKEIYVMLLFQQLWSLIHSTIRMGQAKFLYGLFFGFGGIGAICGSKFTDYCAVKIGSLNLLLGSLPLLCLLAFAFYFLLKFSQVENKAAGETQITNFAKGVKAIRNSKYLLFILAIVVTMQVVTTLVYYQFNTALESSIANQDLRTEYCGRIFGYANIASFAIQLFGAFLLVHFLGLRRSHLTIPIFLLFNAVGSLFFPSFAMITAAFVTIKAFDFSLFGVLKEMLYIPLKQEEKFQAKAIIDVFAYRSSKAVASCLILALQIVGFSEMLPTLSWITFLLLSGWVFLVYRMFQLKAPDASEEASLSLENKEPQLEVENPLEK